MFDEGLAAEDLSIDELIQEWRPKSNAFQALPAPDLEGLDSDLLPLGVKDETLAQVNSVLQSYRYFLPRFFDLAFVPIQKLLTPQKSVSLEHARNSLGDARGPLSNDENALACLGSPLPPPRIDATFLGSARNPPIPDRFDYSYQFISDDPNIRYIPVFPFKPVRDLNLAVEGAPFAFEAKVIPIAVGLGLPIVHVLKVPIAVDPKTRVTTYRLIIANGVHRIFRLAELGNTHVAALVQLLRLEQLPDPFVECPKEQLLVPKPLTISLLADGAVSRTFLWKKTKRTVKLHVTVTQEVS